MECACYLLATVEHKNCEKLLGLENSCCKRISETSWEILGIEINDIYTINMNKKMNMRSSYSLYLFSISFQEIVQEIVANSMYTNKLATI